MKLKINEIFRSFQGEGPSIGLPVTFLRLAVCNLHCVWCDTWYTWNFGKGDGIEERHGSKTVKMEDELHEREPAYIAGQLIGLGSNNLVISGGEPMLQQAALNEMFEQLKDHGFFFNHVEVETNGTIALDPRFNGWIQQINCSPKLQNSGNVLKVRYQPEILKQLQATGKANFKFVVMSELDLLEIDKIVEECGLTNVILMTQGKTKEEQLANQVKTAVLADMRGWRFSPRLHILMYDTKRGV